MDNNKKINEPAFSTKPISKQINKVSNLSCSAATHPINLQRFKQTKYCLECLCENRNENHQDSDDNCDNFYEFNLNRKDIPSQKIVLPPIHEYFALQLNGFKGAEKKN